MKELNYLVEWNRDKKSTWSGTCWGLFSSLQKYFIVKDIDINGNKYQKLIYKIQNLLNRNNDTWNIRNIVNQRKTVNKQLSPKGKIKVLQFSEIIYNSEMIDSYIYLDEDVNHVKYLYEHERHILQISNFSNNNYDSICQRNESQVSYLKQCSGIFTMGRWLKDSISERIGIPPEKIYHVGGGINLNTAKINDTAKSNNKILFVGRDFKRKGGNLVVNAFKLLKQNHPNIELHIAGPSVNPLSQQIEGIYYHGDCNHDKVSELMNICDVFCMPSYYEAYGLVFIEALVYGLPCIGRNAFEMPFFIENGVTGLLIDNDDINELATKMNTLLTDLSYRDRVIAKRNWYITNYSWDSVAQRIYNAINN